MTVEVRMALCLSGGGFRASLFHLGVLKRLHERDLLKRVQLISAVSGGAVAAAVFKKYGGKVVREINDEGKEEAFVGYDWGACSRALGW